MQPDFRKPIGQLTSCTDEITAEWKNILKQVISLISFQTITLFYINFRKWGAWGLIDHDMLQGSININGSYLICKWLQIFPELNQVVVFCVLFYHIIIITFEKREEGITDAKGSFTRLHPSPYRLLAHTVNVWIELNFNTYTLTRHPLYFN